MEATNICNLSGNKATESKIREREREREKHQTER